MYQYLANLGLGISKVLRPTKVKALGRYVAKKTNMKEKAAKYAAKGKTKKAKAIQHLDAFGRKTAKGYTKLYGATLGSSTKRKVTSGVLGGMAVGSFLSGDDIDS